MGYVWMLVPVLPLIVGTALAVSFIGILFSALSKVSNLQQPASALPAVGEILGLYGFAIAFFYLILLIGAFAFYYLIDRRNAHFSRQQQLFSTLQRYLASRTNAPASDNVFRLAELAEESIFQERDRPAGLWSALYLFVTPIVGLIVAYNLTQDIRRHDDLQSAYQTTLANVLSETGAAPPVLAPYRLHKRDPVLFIILTAITGGLFWIYWFYTLLKDYNDHFEDQSHFENQILALLNPQPLTRKCVSCDGVVPETAKFCPQCGAQQVSVA